MARHAETGEAHCLVALASSMGIMVIRESTAVAAGPPVIDAIVWCTATYGEDGIDAALLA